MASTILYFGYTMIMVLMFFLFTGEYVLASRETRLVSCVNMLDCCS